MLSVLSFVSDVTDVSSLSFIISSHSGVNLFYSLSIMSVIYCTTKQREFSGVEHSSLL